MARSLEQKIKIVLSSDRKDIVRSLAVTIDALYLQVSTSKNGKRKPTKLKV